MQFYGSPSTYLWEDEEGEHLLPFLDDIYVVCSAVRVSDVYASLQQELWRHSGIEVQKGKTHLWNRIFVMPSGCEAMTIAARAQDENAIVWRGDHELPPVQQEVKLLGIPLGHAAYVEDQSAKLSLSHSVLLERIQAVTNLPVAWLLLVFCAASRANCYLRVVHPRLVRTFAERHDAAVWRCLQELSGIEGDGTTLDLAQLPFHCGGLSLLQLCSSLGELKWKPSDWSVNWQQRGVSSESWANCPPSGATFSAVSVCWTSVMSFQHGSRALMVSAQANHRRHGRAPSQVCLATDGNSLRLHAMP